MRCVSRNEVVTQWLEMELKKDANENFDISSNIQECEDVARLLVHKPDAASIFWKHDFKWYRHQISEDEFQTLNTVWDGISVFEAAENIKEGTSTLSEDKQEKIESIAENSIDDRGPWIIYRSKGFWSDASVADGNHRAVATALQIIQGEKYQPQTTYVGYPSRGLSKYVRGVFHQLTGQL